MENMGVAFIGLIASLVFWIAIIIGMILSFLGARPARTERRDKPQLFMAGVILMIVGIGGFMLLFLI